MAVLLSLLGIVFSAYSLWVLYLASMNLRRVRDAGKLSASAQVLGKPVYLVGLAVDVLLNFSLFPLLVLSIPREWTITAHLGRLLSAHDTPRWKRAICAWICADLLDPFDPSGTHCSCKEPSHDQGKST